MIRILRNSDELSEALRRAAQFERSAANDLRRRADRYAALINSASLADPAAPAANAPRSPAA